MKRIMKYLCFALTLPLLAACADTARFSDGDIVEARSVGTGALEVTYHRITDAQTGSQRTNVVSGPSMAAQIIPGMATAATGGVISAATALTLDSRQAERCKKGGCGGSPQTVVQVAGATANAVTSSAANSAANTQLGPCGRKVCALGGN